MKKYIGHILILLFSLGCEMAQESQSTIEVIDFRKVKPVVISQDIFPVELLEFLIQDDFRVEGILSLKKVDNSYFLLTAGDGIYFMDDADSGIKSLSEAGRGPGELMYSAYIGLSGKANYLSVIDSGNRKLLLFDMGGQFVKEISVNQWIKNGTLLDEENGLFVGLTSGSKKVNDGHNYLFFVFDENGDIVEGYSEFDRPYQAGMGNGINLYRIGQNEYGIYSMFTNQIFKIDENGLTPHYQFLLDKPLLPDTLITDHMLGKVSLADFVYFFSYFESEEMLVLSYELDRRKYWSIYDKNSDMPYNFYLEHVENCGPCNKINLVGIDGENLFVMVSFEMLERFTGLTVLDSIKANTPDFEFMDYVIAIDVL